MPRKAEMSSHWFACVLMARLHCSTKVLCTPSSCRRTSFSDVSGMGVEAAARRFHTNNLINEVAVCTGDGSGDRKGFTRDYAWVGGCIFWMQAECTISSLRTLSEAWWCGSHIPLNMRNLGSYHYITYVLCPGVGDHGRFWHVLKYLWVPIHQTLPPMLEDIGDVGEAFTECITVLIFSDIELYKYNLNVYNTM